jgi:osmotically-inducible protein OsmY
MDQGSSDGERKVTATIRKAVVADPDLSFSAKNVTIITMGGKVVLRGAVNSIHEKNAIDRYARSTPGVTEVDNELDVKK